MYGIERNLQEMKQDVQNKARPKGYMAEGYQAKECIAFIASLNLKLMSCTGYSVNGYKFHTMKRDANCVTQNSGVTLTAMTHSFASFKDHNPVVGNVNYYGSITEITELSYHGYFSVVVFRCVWFYSEKDDDELIKEKYMVPQAGLRWVMEAVNETSRINKETRLMLDDMHTMGPNSFAILRHELKQQDPNKQEPSQSKVYKESTKRTAGRTYLTNNEKAEQNIAKMDALESSNHEDGSNSKDPYFEVIPNPKRKIHVRLHGKANPRINLVIPNFVMPSAPNDASSAPR
uniref:DUF4218 domain-containing protein n=1 Tax=Chenopodium quinoa TaxID=63459 RepID=A0A803M877_CHEQI